MSEFQYLSIAEAAARIGVNKITIRRYIARGDLPAFRLGERIVRLRSNDVDALLQPVPTVSGGAA